MLMNSKIIHLEMMKNDTPGFNDECNKKNGPGCDSGDCSIRVLYLYFVPTCQVASFQAIIYNR